MQQDTSTIIGCIGFGAMGSAIAQGLIDAGTIPAEHIIACAAHFEPLQRKADELGIQAVRNIAEVASKADVLILAVKPYVYEAVCEQIRDIVVEHGTLVVSIAAGMNYQHMQSMLGADAHVVCTVPNTPIAVGQGIMVTEDVDSLTEPQREQFDKIFGAVAMIERVDSAHMSIAGTVAGCAPAYVAMFMEALADAGVKHGLTRATSYRLAAQMVAGTGLLQRQTGAIPAAMKDAVCSPRGTTIRGVAALERYGFRGAIMQAIDAVEGE